MTAKVENAVKEIAAMNLDALRYEWRRRYGVPPKLSSTLLMRQMLAWRIQADTFGGLALDVRKTLSRTGPVQPVGKHLGVGARLTRIWKGREITVVVEEAGFRWEGKLYASLSAAATAIAGTRWNGPRFFGLRDN